MEGSEELRSKSPSEDETDSRDLREAVANDDGVRCSTDDVMRLIRESA